MDAEQLRTHLRATLGLTVGAHAAAYVLKMLNATPALTTIPILAQDARTGAPIRRELASAEFQLLTTDHFPPA